MKDGQDTDGAADKAAITGEFDDGLGGGLDQRRVTVTLVQTQRPAQLLGHGDDDMKVGGRPHLAQRIEDRLRQRHPPLLVPFADDEQGQLGAVDRANLQGHGLADAQAASIDNR